VILKPARKTGVMLCPVEDLKKNRYRYEHYRGAGSLLSRSREELADFRSPR